MQWCAHRLQGLLSPIRAIDALLGVPISHIHHHMHIIALEPLTSWYCCVLEVSETLDRRKGVESSEMWPPPPVVPDADAPAGSDAQTGNADAHGSADTAQDAVSWEDWPVQAKLAMVLDHLRQSYHYCIFCGCQVCVHTDHNIMCAIIQGCFISFGCSSLT